MLHSKKVIILILCFASFFSKTEAVTMVQQDSFPQELTSADLTNRLIVENAYTVKPLELSSGFYHWINYESGNVMVFPGAKVTQDIFFNSKQSFGIRLEFASTPSFNLPMKKVIEIDENSARIVEYEVPPSIIRFNLREEIQIYYQKSNKKITLRVGGALGNVNSSFIQTSSGSIASTHILDNEQESLGLAFNHIIKTPVNYYYSGGSLWGNFNLSKNFSFEIDFQAGAALRKQNLKLKNKIVPKSNLNINLRMPFILIGFESAYIDSSINVGIRLSGTLNLKPSFVNTKQKQKEKF